HQLLFALRLLHLGCDHTVLSPPVKNRLRRAGRHAPSQVYFRGGMRGTLGQHAAWFVTPRRKKQKDKWAAGRTYPTGGEKEWRLLKNRSNTTTAKVMSWFPAWCLWRRSRR